MSLSNCADCKFNGDHCAVNPDYWQVHRAVAGNLAPATRRHLESLLPDCKDWEVSPDLEPLTLSITLTQREWLAIAGCKITSRNIVPQVRESLNFVPPDSFDDIPF